MIRAPQFALVPIQDLHGHEQIDEEKVVELMAEIRRAGVLSEPIWVARGSLVILNGHHRVEALRRLGAPRIPAWLLDYETDLVSLEPWRPGPPITKAEVVRRGIAGHPFPPKTTRHKIRAELPAHATPLAELLPQRPELSYPVDPRASRRRAPGASRPG